MPVNVKLLKKVRKLIAEEPRRLNMQTWGRDTAKQKTRNPPPCGTVACLAGWTVLAATPKAKWKRMLSSGFLRVGVDGEGNSYGSNVPYKAAELLGFDAPEECPFLETTWGKKDVLRWIDRQIDAASK